MGFFDLFREDRGSLVSQAFEDVTTMVRHGHEMFAAAAAHLYDNEILDVDLIALDNDIKQREQHLRRTVLEHLTIYPNRQLVFSLKLLSIVSEAERIGDLSRSLVKVASMCQRPRLGPHVAPLRSFRDRVLHMFEQVELGFLQENEDVARAHMLEHSLFKHDLTTYLHQLAPRTDHSPNEMMTFAMSARMMSRVSSHLANISSAIVCPFDELRSAPNWAEVDPPVRTE